MISVSSPKNTEGKARKKMRNQQAITQTEELSFRIRPRLCHASICRTTWGSPKLQLAKKHFHDLINIQPSPRIGVELFFS